MVDKLERLKKRLLEELGSDQLDISTLLSLSHDIASLDSSKARFSVDAGIIDRLGKELVSKRETAVSELVKNAYDADATEVKLVFQNAYNIGGSLKIIDNGIGMTREQLMNGFMRLASTDKVNNPISEIYERKKAGKKGIGRFSTQRLGSKLTILTKSKGSNSTIQLSIDWDEYGINQNLYLIEHELKIVDRMWESETGTILIIDNLYESWSDATLKRVYRYTAELIQPFPLARNETNEPHKLSKLDPGFKTTYYREAVKNENIIVDDEEEILRYALAEINGYVDDNGQGYWTLKSDKLDFKEDLFLIGNSEDKEDDNNPFNLIKGLEFKVYYFLFDPNLLPKGKLNFIKSLAHEKGGIRLYRNGFRVLPYGEYKDDWLGLDKSTTRQTILSSHRNFNFFGFIQINDKSGNFEETASREGLIENDAFEELTSFVYKCLINAVQKIAHLRGRKATAGQKDFIPNKKDKDPISKIKEAVESLKKQSKESSGKEDNKFDFKKLEKVIEIEKKNYQLLVDESSMLRILAGLGLVIGEFVHEIKRFVPSFENEIHLLQQNLKNDSLALENIKYLRESLSSFKTYTSFFDTAVTRNIIRELECIELRDVVRNFEEVIEADTVKSNILITTDFIGYDLFTVPMHPSEWASILFNLYSNSKKAIRRERPTLGAIDITCGRLENKVYLEFSDNGDGIPIDREDSVFEAFFTTSSVIDADDEINSLTGTGLGLKIVKDIIEDYDGEIFISPPKDNFSTTIRIELPKGKEDDE
ncbi:ATP-binding protein [Psychrobacter sp. I-STPA6b]|uniref:ATP-binding protein n=1 Tax=Psychrobacter sp. I-STPA6b TaxID=2585718 RepID=UPI001D0C1C81|nr:ATP-binding protein [Psychrobacter sp. I-STPA6b]